MPRFARHKTALATNLVPHGQYRKLGSLTRKGNIYLRCCVTFQSSTNTNNTKSIRQLLQPSCGRQSVSLLRSYCSATSHQRVSDSQVSSASTPTSTQSCAVTIPLPPLNVAKTPPQTTKHVLSVYAAVSMVTVARLPTSAAKDAKVAATSSSAQHAMLAPHQRTEPSGTTNPGPSTARARVSHQKS